MTDQGSRAVGIFSSSTWLMLAPCARRRSSSSGDSDVTVMTSSTAEERVKLIVVFRLSATTTLGCSTVEKPSSSALT